MEKKEKVSNLWFGFVLGTLFTTFFLYLFGTKKGREVLKKFLEYSENLEEKLPDILEGLDINLNNNQGKNSKHDWQEKKMKTDFVGIINRIKFLTSPIKKQTKKFFVKEGKIIEKSS